MNLSDTTNQLLAAVEACISRYRTLVPEGLDTSGCSREARALFSQIKETLRSREPHEQSRLLSAMYSLVYGAFPVPDTRLLSICYAESETYLQENFGRTDAEILCRCLQDYYYPEGDVDGEWFEYLKNTIKEWKALPGGSLSAEQEELVRRYEEWFGKNNPNNCKL